MHWREIITIRLASKVFELYGILDSEIAKDIEYRLGKESCDFASLQKIIWKNKHLKNGTTISVYRAIVLKIFVYGSESWVFYQCHVVLLEHFLEHCLRKIYNIKRFDYIPILQI